ncbi:MAG TPA: YraN family protein [Gammaproteobacteria bacterium]|nr:hypothetical protein [Gammaproteobacteria bacterium]MEC8010417.1 YraN family protein [Pseudomonadota bacterium]HBF09047.1 YraN family protein [Gammaproteobacteria bacterium]HCK94553.1 YraN family protein [Gammaproteobacteria bacterium]|tara:strand:- start:598 stop:1059 length:462 start_codon:yes stop_codon:yes gene_type:complete
MKSKKTYNIYEEAACRFLSSQGLEIHYRNLYWNGGELDIIAIDKTSAQAELVFVEVKFRESDEYGSPLEHIKPAQIRRIQNSASLFLEENPPLNNMPFRFDAIGMLPLDASPLAQQSGTLGQKKNKTLDRLSDAFSSGYAFEGFYIDWIQHCF